MKHAADRKKRILLAAVAAAVLGCMVYQPLSVTGVRAVEPEETEVAQQDWIDGVYPVQHAAIEIDEMDAEQVSSPAAQAQTEPVSGRGTKPAPVTQQPPAIQPAPAPQPALPVITDNQQENCVGDGLTY